MNIKEVRTNDPQNDYDVKLEIDLTTFCNLNCYYCCKYINKIPYADRKHMDLAIFKEAMTKIFSHNTSLKYRIVLLGGEITLYPELEEIFRYLAKYVDQIPQLYLIINGMLSIEKYIGIFPPENILVSSSLHVSVLTDKQVDKFIYNINQINPNVRANGIDILLDPSISEDVKFWQNIYEKIKQETIATRIQIIPLQNSSINDELITYVRHIDKFLNIDPYIITDMNNDVIYADRLNVVDLLNFNFKGLYCYNYNVHWKIDIDGVIFRYCDRSIEKQHFKLSEYDKFFTGLLTATTCICAQCTCQNSTRTKKTIDKEEVEQYYRQVFGR